MVAPGLEGGEVDYTALPHAWALWKGSIVLQHSKISFRACLLKSKTPSIGRRARVRSRRTICFFVSRRDQDRLYPIPFFLTALTQKRALLLSPIPYPLQKSPTVALAKSSLVQCARISPVGQCEFIPSSKCPSSCAIACPRIAEGTT